MVTASLKDVLRKSLTSEKSLNNYMTRLAKLEEVTGKPLDIILKSPKQVYPGIKETYKNINTRKNMITPILTLFKNDPVLQATHADAWATWKRYHEDMNTLQEVNAKKNKMTQKQQENYTSTEEVALKLEELRKQDPHKTLTLSLQYVLLALLNDIKPKRSDLGNIKIYRNQDPNESLSNYLVLMDHPNASYFVLNQYSKTKKIYGKIEEELDRSTVQIIKDSLRKYPREHLFVDRFHKPYVNNDSYGKFVVKCFNDHFGRKTGTSLWRHVFIKEKVDPGAPEEQLEEIARLMLHSPKLQQRYRFADTSGNKVCLCVDKADLVKLKK